jgi:outer membrane protein TolC
MAQDDVNAATASLAETKGYYIPTLGLGGGLGRNYGISLVVPTIFTVETSSLVYNPAQKSYIRAAQDGLQSSELALEDTRQQVEEDTALTYLSLEAAYERRDGLDQETNLATKLFDLTRQRVAAGLGSDIEVKKSRRTLLQIQIQQPEVDSDIAMLKSHLEALTGLKGDWTTASETVPPDNFFSVLQQSPSAVPKSLATLSSQANARSKAEQAHGIQRFALRPEVLMQSQYGRISPISDVSEYYNLNGHYNVLEFGLAIRFPIFDKVREAKAREATISAQHAQHEADLVRVQQQEDHLRLESSIAELAKKVELAELDRDISADQLEALRTEVATASAQATGGRQMTPLDELSAEIDNKQHYLEWLDSRLQLQKAQISWMRQSGQLEDWLHRWFTHVSGGIGSCAPGQSCIPIQPRPQ